MYAVQQAHGNEMKYSYDIYTKALLSVKVLY